MGGRVLRSFYEWLPAWLRPTLFMSYMLLAMWVTLWLIGLLMKLDQGLTRTFLIAGGGAVLVASLTFGVLRQFAFDSERWKVWGVWPLSCLVGAFALLPLTDLAMGRRIFSVIPPLGWLLVFFGIPLIIGIGFAYGELRERKRSEGPF